jgi:hypothetical protein
VQFLDKDKIFGILQKFLGNNLNFVCYNEGDLQYFREIQRKFTEKEKNKT